MNEKHGVINAKLSLASPSDGSIAQTLDLTLTVYQNGILRMLIEEPEVKRFRISQDDLNPVMDEQLVPVDLTDKVYWDSVNPNYFAIQNLTNED